MSENNEDTKSGAAAYGEFGIESTTDGLDRIIEQIAKTIGRAADEGLDSWHVSVDRPPIEKASSGMWAEYEPGPELTIRVTMTRTPVSVPWAAG